MEHAKEIVFLGVVSGVATYDALLFFSIAKPQRRFWPLPPRHTRLFEIGFDDHAIFAKVRTELAGANLRLST